MYTNNWNISFFFFFGGGGGNLIVKLGVRIGHLNGYLAPRSANLNKPIFNSSNTRAGDGRGLPGGMLKFRTDRRVS